MSTQPQTHTPAGHNVQILTELYRHMVTARALDTVEEELVTRGEAFFMVSGAGHEGSVALVPHLIRGDWLHCHYRDKALMLARGMTPLDFLRGLLCKRDSHSAGRQMSAHMSDPSLNVMSIVGPVGNSALQAAGVAAAVRERPERPLVLCSMGDGTTQEGEALESIAEAVRWELPVLFLVEDNRFAISTTTPGKTLYSLPDGEADSFYGLPIQRVEGWDVVNCLEVFARAVGQIRENRRPALVVMKTERLASHTNADDQAVYRSDEQIEQSHRQGDPIRKLARYLQENGFERAELDAIEAQAQSEVRQASEEALDEPNPPATSQAKRPLPDCVSDPVAEYRGQPREDGEARLTMLEAIREVLRGRILSDERVFLYGEDIEDPKGDVFGITRGLSTLRPGQVKNSPLAEASIVGTAIGRALAGQRPVAFLQFADFFPIAYNQIISEMGSMYWRTNGQWECPVIVMITCGGYRPGLGPFHAQTFESVGAHTPGVDVCMPSTAADAAGLLNAAFESGRPTLYFYPKNCLNDRERTTSVDVHRQLACLGKARVVRLGRDLTMVGWGNTVALCARAAEFLAEVGVEAEVIDLRSLSPWDRAGVVQSARKTGKLLVAHEDNLTCGFGAEVLAAVAEQARRPIQMRRVARADTYIPCNFANQLEVLPSVKDVLGAAAEMCGLDLTWELPEAVDGNLFQVEAIGSSPSDESLEIIKWMVKEGSEVSTGQLLADVEADKATLELTSPVSGVVQRILVEEGERIKVGAPIVELRVASKTNRRKPSTREMIGKPILHRVSDVEQETEQRAPFSAPLIQGSPRAVQVGMGRVYVSLGGRRVSNEELRPRFDQVSSQDIIDRTGIEERRWVGEGEDALSLAVRAVRGLLEGEQLDPKQLDLLICTTGTPSTVTPSMACQILSAVAGDAWTAAYDLNAACSGYIYALQAGYNFLSNKPDGNVLIVTTEVLSPLLDLEDFSTSIIFGDGASATLLRGGVDGDWATARLSRPVVSGKGDPASTICVPLPGAGKTISMNGRRVFAEAVRQMEAMLNEACRQVGLTPDDLSLIVPHQANQRIIDAIQKRFRMPKAKMYSNIRKLGNTSSTTIPMCLHDLLGARAPGEHIGLCAFGGGFTFAAAILETV